jgi:hypothetical protein
MMTDRLTREQLERSITGKTATVRNLRRLAHHLKNEADKTVCFRAADELDEWEQKAALSSLSADVRAVEVLRGAAPALHCLEEWSAGEAAEGRKITFGEVNKMCRRLLDAITEEPARTVLDAQGDSSVSNDAGARERKANE